MQLDKESTLHNIDLKMLFCVVPSGSGDCGEQNSTTCQSSLEEKGNQQGESEEDMDNTDLQDSAVGWDTEASLYYELHVQV